MVPVTTNQISLRQRASLIGTGTKQISTCRPVDRFIRKDPRIAYGWWLNPNNSDSS